MPKPSESETDEELMLRSRTDKSALGEIFRRHHGDIHRFLVRAWGPEVGADLASETFLYAIGSRHSYDPAKGSVRAWLFGIAINVKAMEGRKHGRALKGMSRLWAGEATEEDFVGELAVRVDAMQEAERLGLHEKLRSLPEEDRVILLLHALAGLSRREIAEAVDLPVGTVKSRLHRTIAMLREIFGEETLVGNSEGTTHE